LHLRVAVALGDQRVAALHFGFHRQNARRAAAVPLHTAEYNASIRPKSRHQATGRTYWFIALHSREFMSGNFTCSRRMCSARRYFGVKQFTALKNIQ
jgi:hypothetical protein